MANSNVHTLELPLSLERLRPYFYESEKTWEKITGPKTVDLDVFLQSEEWQLLKEFLNKNLWKDFEVVGGNFFQTQKPYIIHTDGHHEKSSQKEELYNVVIPIEVGPNSAKTNLIIFNQKYFGPPSKFVFGDCESDFPVTTYPYISNYYDVSELADGAPLVKDEELEHLRPRWLKGLTIKEKVPWRPGSLIVFASQYLHCSSSFRVTGVEQKLGLSLFIKRINR